MPELDCSVFLIPGDTRKNEQDHVCVLNSVARSIIERCRGKHPTAVFTYRGKPLHSVNNTAWLNARKRAAAKPSAVSVRPEPPPRPAPPPIAGPEPPTPHPAPESGKNPVPTSPAPPVWPELEDYLL